MLMNLRQIKLFLQTNCYHDRGGSRVVQVICRNHSNVSKYLRFFISQVRYVVQKINYPSCFIVYYKIKQRKKRRISLFR